MAGPHVLSFFSIPYFVQKDCTFSTSVHRLLEFHLLGFLAGPSTQQHARQARAQAGSLILAIRLFFLCPTSFVDTLYPLKVCSSIRIGRTFYLVAGQVGACTVHRQVACFISQLSPSHWARPGPLDLFSRTTFQVYLYGTQIKTQTCLPILVPFLLKVVWHRQLSYAKRKRTFSISVLNNLL